MSPVFLQRTPNQHPRQASLHTTGRARMMFWKNLMLATAPKWARLPKQWARKPTQKMQKVNHLENNEITHEARCKNPRLVNSSSSTYSISSAWLWVLILSMGSPATVLQERRTPQYKYMVPLATLIGISIHGKTSELEHIPLTSPLNLSIS